jgi:hypothetical protein
MIVSHLLLILHKKYSFISLCLKPEMWQKVAKFKGAEYFLKALYTVVLCKWFPENPCSTNVLFTFIRKMCTFYCNCSVHFSLCVI